MFKQYGDRIHFVEVLVRQAHPGPGARPYRTVEEKRADAAWYKERFALPWTVVVDDLRGTVHRQYGGMADPTYIIDRDGRVAFYNMWTSAVVLNAALRDLLAQGGRGVVGDGWERLPHLLPAVTAGWPGLERGAPQSVEEQEAAIPYSARGIQMGYTLKPLLAPITLRTEPLPLWARAAIVAGAAVVGAIIVRANQTARS